MYSTKDPSIEFPDGQRNLPVMTTMLYRVCDNDGAKFEEAWRLVDLLIKETLTRYAPE